MNVFPVEIWQEIFTLSCIDSGSTGRSLSLVCKYFRDISAPFKYQSLVIIGCQQVIDFCKVFSQLPDTEKTIKYLLVHCPYHILHVEGRPMPAVAGDSEERRQSEDAPAPDDEPSGESNNQRERPIDSDESLCNAIYPINSGSSSMEGRTTHNPQTDDGMQLELEPFKAFHDILNGSSSTLKLLSVCWSSSDSRGQYYEILPPLPVLEELHFSCDIINGWEWWKYGHKFPTSSMFPSLRFLCFLGDQGFNSIHLPIVAPNVTHLRFSLDSLRVVPNTDLEPPSASKFHHGGIVVETSWRHKYRTKVIQKLTRSIFWKIQESTPVVVDRVDPSNGRGQEEWLLWWKSRVRGDSGPWEGLLS